MMLKSIGFKLIRLFSDRKMGELTGVGWVWYYLASKLFFNRRS